mgnify:CR=1 FL=1
MLEFRRLRALVFVSLLVPVIGASCSAPTEERCPDGSRAVGCAPTVDASHDGGTPRDATGDGAFHDGETDQGGSNDDVSRHDASRSDAEPGCVAPSRRMCGGACVACPEGPEVLTTKCAADRCAAASCQPEWRLWGDACCADPTEGVLESAGTTGVFPDLEFDAVGNPHISYFDGTAGQLKHGFWNGTAWRFEVIGPASVEESTDLELDARGNAYVAWYDPDARALRLASRVDGAPWSTETVTNLDDASSPGGPYNALALDAAGHPHIAYHVRVDQTLRYARWDGAAWQQELIADTVMAGMHLSLAIDQAGHAHISYAESFDHLRYAHHDGQEWQIEAVDGDAIAENTAIAVDAQNQPQITYYDFRDQQLKHVQRDGAQWVTTVLEDDDFTGTRSSLALDAAGQPHVTYSVLDDSLRYAHRDAAGVWHLGRVIEVGPMMGTTSSVVIHPATALPHVAYYDGTAFDLEYLIVKP